MLETIFGIAIISVACVIIIAYITQTKKRQWQQQQTLISQLLQLKTIIAFTQKHRGMCAAYIQGDEKALNVLTSIDNTLQPVIEKLNNEPFLMQQGRWIGYLDHWQRLKKQYKQLDLTTSFNQHTNLITNLLYLFEDISEHRAFNKKSFKGTSNSSVLWQELPFTAEYVGQARAVGVAIVARGTCTQVDKVKIGYLATKIPELSNRIFSYLERNGSEQLPLINHARNKCQSFTNLLQTELLEVNQVNISTEQYFSAASQAMDSINRLLDAELSTLHEHIKRAY
ncbi:nitrate- and nitrite sensing domain-containing protein [Paraglaciecola sp. L3A3]|uniref:nitrate- and nitrite sensing domain-containing protein n=1 Tax=Paraglaciecola sp. L3A3 TaxID=2686358 RepID=UPI00131E8BF6|nr:nitrate- and nitrite sensing domain-containing protein [Paraglaciecola sp. L3A3]